LEKEDRRESFQASAASLLPGKWSRIMVLREGVRPAYAG
jgi:hypothetical protein